MFIGLRNFTSWPAFRIVVISTLFFRIEPIDFWHDKNSASFDSDISRQSGSSPGTVIIRTIAAGHETHGGRHREGGGVLGCCPMWVMALFSKESVQETSKQKIIAS